ncbi:DUF4391 domain-containing protein [Methanococcoides sp. AM1]|uniref:DUF4391 domain-containing protein n=1 Tax=Methanococcoides sp. AM1 TaxID=1201011 RepID=UPI001082D839|nr:DUF4391 domain-containing protein [Methanococcoides sp. AM1]
MSILYDFPKRAVFGRMLSKTKIYEHSTPSSKVKELFTKEVEKMTWAYKLSPATLNLPVSEGVHEIQVITIILKTGTLAEEVLQTIDKAIPSPILFHLSYKDKSKYVAAYKRPSEADKNKWIISSYFKTEWINDSSDKVKLPVVLNMGALYQSFLKAIIPLPFKKNESLDELVARIDNVCIKERNATKIEYRMKKEKQFNRRVEMNGSLNELKQEIEELKS